MVQVFGKATCPLVRGSSVAVSETVLISAVKGLITQWMLLIETITLRPSRPTLQAQLRCCRKQKARQAQR
jgi:hypothetical protein